MLYLAQVRKDNFLDQYELCLLARQEAGDIWAVITGKSRILLEKTMNITEKLLVLVETSPTGEIEKIEDPTAWIMHVVEAYLGYGITPEVLRQEVERAENWRQSLTLQNQDLARRTLELEARRENMQALEENLQRQALALEARHQEIIALEKKLKVSQDDQTKD